MFSGLFKEEKTKEAPLYERINQAVRLIDKAKAVVIGAGAGLSTAAGLDFGGGRFEKYMHDFGEKYGYHDMYSGDFYHYDTLEEYWAFEAKSIFANRYDTKALPLYEKLYRMVKDRNYFVITTNVDHQFYKAGFPKQRVFATQGDYGLFQCAKGCNKKLYDNEAAVMEMVKETKDLKIPSRLLPKCPVCGGEAKANLRADEYFVEDEEWDKACKRYETFIKEISDKDVVYLEFGIGYNTPGIIRYPFEQMTYKNPLAHLIRFNKDYPYGAAENEEKTIRFTEDISMLLEKMYPNV